MPLRRRPKSSTGFLGFRLRPSGHYAAELTADEHRWWLGTFESADLTPRAYDAAAWRFGRPRSEMNFPEVENRVEAEFLAPELRIVTREQEKENRRAFLQLRAEETSASPPTRTSVGVEV